MTATATTTPATSPGTARAMTPARATRHALTMAWRTLVRIRRNPEQLLDVTLQPIVFVTLFVFLFGGAIKGQDRHGYLQYVLPGITVLTVVFASMGTGIGLNTDLTKGIFDRFHSLPIARSAPLTGTIIGDFSGTSSRSRSCSRMDRCSASGPRRTPCSPWAPWA